MRTFLALLLAAFCVHARPVAVRWSETPEVFAGKKISVYLSSGANIQGRWIRVTPDTFTMQVDISGTASVAKGVQTLPRRSVQRIGIRKHQVWGRVLGTAAGFFAVCGIVVATSEPGYSNEGGGLLAIGGSIAGYFVGSHFDHGEKQILIIDP